VLAIDGLEAWDYQRRHSLPDKQIHSELFTCSRLKKLIRWKVEERALQVMKRPVCKIRLAKVNYKDLEYAVVYPRNEVIFPVAFREGV